MNTHSTSVRSTQIKLLAPVGTSNTLFHRFADRGFKLCLLLLTILLLQGCSWFSSGKSEPEAENQDMPMDVVIPSDPPTQTTQPDAIDEPDTNVPVEDDNNASNEPIDIPPQTDLATLFPNRTSLFGESFDALPPYTELNEFGDLSWAYDIVDDQLVYDYGTPAASHQFVWQRYQQITPLEQRSSVRKITFEVNTGNVVFGSIFAVLSNPTSKQPGTAYVEMSVRESFVSMIYDAHTAGTAQHPFYYTEVFIHEHGHVLQSQHEILLDESYDEPTFELASSYVRYPWDSTMHDYYRTFFTDDISMFWESLFELQPYPETRMQEQYPDTFVSQYASNHPLEDFAETFVRFVYEDEQPELGAFSGSAKVRWFWQQPDYVLLRDYIRQAIN